jgi:HEPN domain-containing protein
MMQPTDLARQYLSVADRDLRTFRLLVATPSIADEAIGFHAQQVVEKCLKAVLAISGVDFRRIHDITELLALYRQHNLPLPPYASTLDELNPFAAMLRYEIFYTTAIDRTHVAAMVEAVHAWAAGLV